MFKNEVRFSNQWFNPLYFHIRKYVDDPSIRRIMIYGGKGSAKTLTASQLFLILGHMKNCSSIVYRKEQTTVKTTVKESFLKAIKLIRFERAYTEQDFKFRGAFGNDILLKGLDEDKKIKGIEGYKYLLFDELDHFTADDWTQANISLRGMHNMKLFATWNPVDENIWIKKFIDKHKWKDLPKSIPGNPYSQLHHTSWIRLSEDGKTLLIKTTYHDNKWMTGGKVGKVNYGYRDENLIHEYESLKGEDEMKYNVNVLGEWGVLRTGMEYYHAFKTTRHVGRPEYNPELPLHITFDHNVNPYMTLLINQLELKDGLFYINVLDEYCLPHPFNKTEYVCQRFYKDYHEHASGLYYYGDATSMKNNTMTIDEIRHDYDIVEKVLRTMLHNNSRRVPKSNPAVLKRKDFMDEILREQTDLRLVIHEKCKNTINDFLYLKEGPDGKKFKEKEEEKITGAKYEKYGHTSDAEEYLICKAFENLFRRYERR